MTDLNAKPAGSIGEPTGSGRDAGIIETSTEDYNRNLAPLSRPRRLDPRIGALAKLDACEHRLHIANTTGDSDTWGRYYLAWVKLHRVAFGGEL